MTDHFTAIKTARAAILSDLKKRFQERDPTVLTLKPDNEHHWYKPQDNYFSGSGEIECPVCGTGKLRYRRSSYNGHVHASCTTDACVSWME